MGGNYTKYKYSITSLVRASLVRGPSVVRGFERQNFSSHPLKIASNNTIFLLNFVLNRPQNGSSSYNRPQTA